MLDLTLPDFLRNRKVRPVRADNTKETEWMMPEFRPGKAHRKQRKEHAYLIVYSRIRDGMDTYQKIRKACDVTDGAEMLTDNEIRLAIRHLKRDRKIEQTGRRYSPVRKMR